MSSEQQIKKLHQVREQALQGGGKERIEIQHGRGKLTARERIDLLLDKGSFRELDPFVQHSSDHFGMERKRYLGDGVVCGWGTVEGRLIYVSSQDFTVMGGSIGEAHAAKICKLFDLALKNGVPVVCLNDSGGARIQEGVFSLAGCAEIFLRNTLASGVIPQISAILGPCAGAAVYSPALTDFTFMVQGTSQMYLTGPDVVRAVTHEDVTAEDLGGAGVHGSISGVAHVTTENDAECLERIRTLLLYLPQNNLEDPPYRASNDDPLRTEEALDRIIPDDPLKPYEMRLRKSRPFRPLLRFVQHPDRHTGRRTRVHPRHRTGAQRDHPLGRETPLRVLRGDGAEGYGDHPQSLRRRLHRDVVEAPARGRQPGLAKHRNCGDGAGRGDQHRLPQGARDGEGTRKAAQGAGRRLRREIRQPVRSRLAGIPRRRDRAARNPPASDQRPGHAGQQTGYASIEEAREHSTVRLSRKDAWTPAKNTRG
jgi:hypothetical protein